MGYLHEEPPFLIDLIRERSDVLILSIFVNPTQFGLVRISRNIPGLGTRSSALQEEGGLCLRSPCGGDLSFRCQHICFRGRSQFRLCGRQPTHFPRRSPPFVPSFSALAHHLALGQKDAQQVVVLKRMIRDLHFPIEGSRGPPFAKPTDWP